MIPRPDEGNYHLGAVPASASLGVGVTFFAQPLTGNTVALNSEFALDRAEVEDVRMMRLPRTVSRCRRCMIIF